MMLNDLNILDIGNTIQLVGVVYAGKGKKFTCIFPDEHLEGFEAQELKMNKEEWMRFIRQTDLLETEIVAKGSDAELVKVVVRKSTRQIEQNVSWKVFKRDEYSCRYCGLNDGPLTVDHLVCWEEGGPSTVENLVAACRACNRTRGNLKYEDWLRHPYYAKRKEKLSPFVRALNEGLVATLENIPRQIQKRAR